MPEKSSRRLDQWLWFARFAKSRSLAARRCAAGEIAVNGVAAAKSNHAIKAGDVITIPQGQWQRTVQVLAAGERRGPAKEAHALFAETGAALRATPHWEPLLFADDGDE